jgi:hypothetical protein
MLSLLLNPKWLMLQHSTTTQLHPQVPLLASNGSICALPITYVLLLWTVAVFVTIFVAVFKFSFLQSYFSGLTSTSICNRTDTWNYFTPTDADFVNLIYGSKNSVICTTVYIFLTFHFQWSGTSSEMQLICHLILFVIALWQNHVKWVHCHHGMVRPPVADRGDRLQI